MIKNIDSMQILGIFATKLPEWEDCNIQFWQLSDYTIQDMATADVQIQKIMRQKLCSQTYKVPETPHLCICS